MTAGPEFDRLLHRALRDVHDSVQEPPDLTDRLLAGVTARPPRRLPAHSRAKWILPLLAAAVVVAVAVAVIAASMATSHRRPAVPVPTPSSSAPDSGPSPTTSPTSTPSTDRAGSRPAATALTVAGVENGTIDIPAWPESNSGCASGPLKFTSGRAVVPSSDYYAHGLQIDGTPVIQDVTGDGVADAVAIVDCDLHQPIASRVVLLTGGADGSIVTTATVVEAAFSASVDPAVGFPKAVKAASDANVVVTWGAGIANVVAPQDRTYTYANGRFTQTGGPTAFPVPPTPHLSVQVAPVPARPLPGGGSGGPLVVTIHNAGPGAAPDGVVLLNTNNHELGLDSTTGGTAPGDMYITNPVVYRVFIAAIPAGGTVTVTFNVRYFANPAPSGMTVEVGNETAPVLFKPG